MPWAVLECCDEYYITCGENSIENSRIRNFEKYMIEQGMDNISEKLNKVSVNVQPDIPVEDIWGKLPFSEYYENLQRMINAGGI